jgi:hypothetical protein
MMAKALTSTRFSNVRFVLKIPPDFVIPKRGICNCRAGQAGFGLLGAYRGDCTTSPLGQIPCRECCQ